MKDTLCSIFYG